MQTDIADLDYEPFAPQFRDNPEHYYDRLRREAPVYRSKAGYWVLTRFDDVKTALRDHERYSNALVGREALSQATHGETIDVPGLERAPVDVMALLGTPNMVSTDPPRHTDLRRIVGRAFMPKSIARWDDYIAACTSDCLAGVSDHRAWDVVTQLSMPLPVAVICKVLGIEVEHGAKIKRWSDTIIETAQGDDRGKPEARRRVLTALLEFSEFFVPLLEDRKRRPREDMLSDLVRAEDGESLSVLDTLTFIKSLMLAGNETTTGLIGNTIVLLLRNPDQLATVQADPRLLRNAIEESLRYHSPVQFAVRSPVADIEIRGQRIARDEPILAGIGAANRDPDEFADPARFDVTRKVSTHLAFGNGIHTCIGFNLARREAYVALAAIIPRLHRWRLTDAPLKRIGSNFVFGYEAIPLEPA